MSQFNSFEEFYQHYLREHGREGTRAMHFSGIMAFLVCLLFAVLLRQFSLFVVGVILGYLPAVASHFIYEGNKPASLKNPFYSILADFRLFYDLLTKKQSFSGDRQGH